MNLLVIATFATQHCIAIVPYTPVLTAETPRDVWEQSMRQSTDLQNYTAEAKNLILLSTPLFDARGLAKGEHVKIYVGGETYYAVCKKDPRS